MKFLLMMFLMFVVIAVLMGVGMYASGTGGIRELFPGLRESTQSAETSVPPRSFGELAPTATPAGDVSDE